MRKGSKGRPRNVSRISSGLIGFASPRQHISRRTPVKTRRDGVVGHRAAGKLKQSGPSESQPGRAFFWNAAVGNSVCCFTAAHLSDYPTTTSFRDGTHRRGGALALGVAGLTPPAGRRPQAHRAARSLSHPTRSAGTRRPLNAARFRILGGRPRPSAFTVATSDSRFHKNRGKWGGV